MMDKEQLGRTFWFVFRPSLSHERKRDFGSLVLSNFFVDEFRHPCLSALFTAVNIKNIAGTRSMDLVWFGFRIGSRRLQQPTLLFYHFKSFPMVIPATRPKMTTSKMTTPMRTLLFSFQSGWSQTSSFTLTPSRSWMRIQRMCSVWRLALTPTIWPSVEDPDTRAPQDRHLIVSRPSQLSIRSLRFLFVPKHQVPTPITLKDIDHGAYTKLASCAGGADHRKHCYSSHYHFHCRC